MILKEYVLSRSYNFDFSYLNWISEMAQSPYWVVSNQIVPWVTEEEKNILMRIWESENWHKIRNGILFLHTKGKKYHSIIEIGFLKVMLRVFNLNERKNYGEPS